MKKSSIFIVPRASTAWRGNEAGWITASGWAKAGELLWGEAVVATADGVFAPNQSRLFPVASARHRSKSNQWSFFRRFIPEFLITAVKDIKLYLSKPSAWPVENQQLLHDKKVVLIWERHDLFPGPGRRLANTLNVPLIISVEAPVVWEAKKWGINRPIWGNWLEAGFEAKSLQGADLVSCVSEEVKQKVIQMGVSPHKVIVSPNRVDSSLFFPGVDGQFIAQKYNLINKRVIGWTGSFRVFHGLDTVLKAFKIVRHKFDEVVLVLVGDGQELPKIRKMITELSLEDSVILPGKQPFILIPQFVANFYISLVSAASANGFHYSPLKLREYMAVGSAVIAPKAGDLPLLFQDGRELLFYNAGDVNHLSEKLCLLLEDQSLHDALSANAIGLFEKDGTWLHELKRIAGLLNIND